MHTANRHPKLSSSSVVKLRRLAYVALPGLLMIYGLFSFSVIEARRNGVGGSGAASVVSLPVKASSAATTFTVNSVSDSGAGSLRSAIDAANSTPGADSIVFNLGTGTPTINLLSALPTITEAVTINGNTGGATRVELNGAGAGANANGLTISGGNSVIANLVINRFSGDGIRITGTGFNTIKGCIIGLDASGTIVRANNVGVAIRGSSDNTIGSTAFVDRNTISGNTTDGVLITTVTILNPPPNPPTVIAASRNKVINSYIGSDITGRFDLGNTLFGVNISGGDASIIGGATEDERNIISGNNGGGIQLAPGLVGDDGILERAAAVQAERRRQRVEVLDGGDPHGLDAQRLGQALALDESARHAEASALDAEREAHEELTVVLLAAVVERVARRPVAERGVPVHAAHQRVDFRGGHAGGVEAADHRAHAGAGDGIHRYAQFLERLQHADVRKPARTAARQHEADARPRRIRGRLLRGGRFRRQGRQQPEQRHRKTERRKAHRDGRIPAWGRRPSLRGNL